MWVNEPDYPSLTPSLTREPVAETAPARAPSQGLALQLRGVAKSFGARHVLQALDLSVAPGEFVALVGRSGCGKSTLLRLIAGLDAPSAGLVDAGAAHERRLHDARLVPRMRGRVAGLTNPARSRRVIQRRRRGLIGVPRADFGDVDRGHQGAS